MHVPSGEISDRVHPSWRHAAHLIHSRRVRWRNPWRFGELDPGTSSSSATWAGWIPRFEPAREQVEALELARNHDKSGKILSLRIEHRSGVPLCLAALLAAARGAPSWAPGPSCSERRLVQVGRVGMCHTLIHTLIHTHVLYLCLFFPLLYFRW